MSAYEKSLHCHLPVDSVNYPNGIGRYKSFSWATGTIGSF